MGMVNRLGKLSTRSALSFVAVTFAGLSSAGSVQDPVHESSPQAQEETKPPSKKLPPAADNSGKNVRDRDSNRLTPGNQGKSAPDVAMTRNIRKEVNAQKGLSVNGKNVKIITLNSIVTLRGPVGTAEEKQLIHEIACKLAGSDKVKNELEVR